MGNPDHLAKLREGPVAWNDWRADNPGLTPDLSNVVLSAGETLLGPVQGGPFDLRDALLNRANFDSAVLAGAILENADLRGANLSCASLVSADLSFANLYGAILQHADFQDAKLTGTIFDAAQLELAVNLTQAQIEEAYGDEATSLPPPLTVPESWRRDADFFSEEELPESWRRDADTLEDAEEEPADPYVLFGLTRKAKPDEIRAAYLRLAKRYHPDMNPGNVESERQFKRVGEAYRMLNAIEFRRAQRRARPRRVAARWASAMAPVLLAVLTPAAGVYWFGNPNFLAENASSVAEKSASSDSQPEPQVAAFMELQRIGTRSELVTGSATTPAAAAPEAEAEPAIAPAPDTPPAPAPEKIAATLPQEMPAPKPETPAATPPQATQPAPKPEKPLAAAPQENLSERIETAGQIPATVSLPASTPAIAAAPADVVPAATSLDNGPALMAHPASGSGAEPQPGDRVAALQDGAPAKPAADAPWDEEWRLLRKSTDLLPLQNFIARYPQKPVTEEARERFRTLVAAVINRQELQAFLEKAGPDSPEKALANRQLALLVEKENYDADEQAWRATREAGTVAAFQAYLVGYPNGHYADDAEERIAALEAEISGRKKETTAWSKARQTGTREAIQSYIQAYPKGRHTDDAKRRLAALNTREEGLRKEDEAWAKAQKEKTRKGYFAYLNAYPNGRYASQAQQSLEAAGPAPTATGAAAPASPETPKQRQSQRNPRPSSDEPFVDRVPGGSQ
ncbi:MULTISPECIES: DnaJ domain-containing protein [Rhodomicrobium]|uniref:DnaJ domain-containing protein n=1 Tax=Rhodomicrobium TaxID=1068 RepID=UPI000B4BABC2|nr:MULTISPECIES: DnaJ domain-containing protein [Rhodomicrobium]